MKLGTIIVISSLILFLGSMFVTQTSRYLEAENQILEVEYDGEVITDLRYGLKGTI